MRSSILSHELSFGLLLSPFKNGSTQYIEELSAAANRGVSEECDVAIHANFLKSLLNCLSMCLKYLKDKLSCQNVGLAN